MKKNRKSGAGKNRRQTGNGQARLKTDDNLREGLDRVSKSHETKPRDPSSVHPGAKRKPPRGTDEQKRKLWERKQAELEARRVASEARRREERAERQRTMRIAISAAVIGTVTLGVALTWYFV